MQFKKIKEKSQNTLSFHSRGIANKYAKMLNLFGNQEYLAFHMFRKAHFSRQEDKAYFLKKH